jgi:enoyl-CoA hydratase
MNNDIILYTKEGPIGLITVNRPEVKNSLNMAVFRRLSDILDEIASDEEVRVIIITGAGTTFMAGADINELLALTITDGWSNSRYRQSVFTKLERLGKPSIAAINGACLGGGLELALCCTFRIAAPSMKMGFPEMTLGIITGFGGSFRTIRVVGQARAAEMLLLSSFIPADEALRVGLVHRVEEDCMAKAKEMAATLAALSPDAVRLGLELLHESENNNLETGLALESALAALAVNTPEAKERLAKFLNKGKGK